MHVIYNQPKSTNVGVWFALMVYDVSKAVFPYYPNFRTQVRCEAEAPWIRYGS